MYDGGLAEIREKYGWLFGRLDALNNRIEQEGKANIRGQWILDTLFEEEEYTGRGDYRGEGMPYNPLHPEDGFPRPSSQPRIPSRQSDDRAINTIPPGSQDVGCQELLLVTIGTGQAELAKGLDDALIHIFADCPRTRIVIFYALRWSDKEWAARRRRFQNGGIYCALQMGSHELVELN